MDNKSFFIAYRSALYEGFLSNKDAPRISVEKLQELKKTLDQLEPKFLSNHIGIEDMVSEVKDSLEQPQTDITPMWNIGRDLCIGAWMAIGAAILAAWVASGGTLVVGTAIAGVTISQPIIAALVGGASAGTIACMAGSCGGC